MPVIPEVEIDELNHNLGLLPPGADDIMVVIGNSSKGPPGVPALYSDITGLVADFGEGDMPEDAARAIEDDNGTVVYAIRTPSSNPGTMGTIDVSGVTGTAVPTVSGTPTGPWEYWFKVASGGKIGDGTITFWWDIADGRSPSGVTGLGLGNTFTFPIGGAVLTFENPPASLVTQANAIKAKWNAHVIYITGGVHGLADAGDATAVANATDDASAITLLNDIRTKALAHFILTTGTVHALADTSMNVALTAVAAATDGETAVLLADVLEAVINAHETNSAATIVTPAGTTTVPNTTHAHAVADTVNNITATLADSGTLAVNDVIRVKGTGPKWAQADLLAAGATLVAGQQSFGFLQVTGPVSATECGVIATVLDNLRAQHKFKWAICGARQIAAIGETNMQWKASLAADYASIQRDDIAVCAGDMWITSAISAKQIRRPVTGSVAARCAAIDIQIDAAKVKLGALPNCTLYDSMQNPIAHDEGKDPGLTQNRFVTCRTFDELGLGVYVTNPVLMSGPTSDFQLIQQRRVMSVLERTVYIEALSVDLNAEGTVDDNGFVSEISARDIDDDMRNAIKDALGAAISNPDDPKLFTLSRTDHVLTNGGELNGSSSVQGLFYIKKLKVKVGFTATATGV